jgi:hypothetical protein
MFLKEILDWKLLEYLPETYNVCLQSAVMCVGVC